jgi:hypothetical protein
MNERERELALLEKLAKREADRALLLMVLLIVVIVAVCYFTWRS